MLTHRRIILTDWITDILFLSTVLLCFYALWLNSYPFFTPDEGRYSEVAREMVASGDYITPRVNGIVFLDKPAFYYWLQAAAIHLFGVKEWSLRLFPVLFGILGCLITYACGRILFNRLTGILSAIILATTPLYFACAHYANLDLEVAVLVSAALLFFITAMSVPNHQRIWMYLAYFCSALAVLTKGMIGIVFPIMIIGLWILLTRRFRVLLKMSIPMGILLFFIVLFPWYWQVQQANPAFLHYFFVTQHITRYLSGAAFNNQWPIWFYGPVVIFGFFPWVLLLPQIVYQSLRQYLRHDGKLASTSEKPDVTLFLWLWATTVFIFFSLPQSKIISYILPIFPPLALLTAHYLAELWQASKTRAPKIVLIFGCGSILFAALSFLIIQQNWFNLPKPFHWQLGMIAFTFFISALILIIFYKKISVRTLFIVCTTTISAYLMIFLSGANYLNVNTAKPLVTLLRTLIKPEDEVVHYYKYFYDVPLYLGKQVKVVADWNPAIIMQKDNWARELLNGKYWGDTRDKLLEEKKFWHHFYSSHRLFVFVNANYWEQFKSQAKSYFVLGKYNDIILLSNQPSFISESYLKTHNLFDINVKTGSMVKTNNKATG